MCCLFVIEWVYSVLKFIGGSRNCGKLFCIMRFDIVVCVYGNSMFGYMFEMVCFMLLLERLCIRNVFVVVFMVYV